MAMQHKRQAPGRDVRKHFSLAPARSHTITASSKASATATRNPPPHPVPYKTGPKLAMRRIEDTTPVTHVSLPPPALLPSPLHTSNHECHEWAQKVKGGETPPACASPSSGVQTCRRRTTAHSNGREERWRRGRKEAQSLQRNMLGMKRVTGHTPPPVTPTPAPAPAPPPLPRSSSFADPDGYRLLRSAPRRRRCRSA